MQPLSAPLRPGGFLSILFNQPVVAGAGRIRFKQVFPGTSFFGAEERVVAGGAIGVLCHEKIWFPTLPGNVMNA